MTETINTTRLELLKTKERIKVANKGLDLLKIKRSSLVMAFFDLARQIKLLKANLKSTITSSLESIKIADIYSGRIEIERIAAERSRLGLGLQTRNVMGVIIPNIDIKNVGTTSVAYQLISVPTPVQDASVQFGKLFELVIKIAEKENSLRKLLHEIEKVNRRANIIEHVKVPEMKSKVMYIGQRLADLERDNIVALKFIKGKMIEQ